ncbi:MAG: carboxypeptidase-like regulatory domain-containing protein [Williamsia sp.]|nr:carboxypeptidase-like regulatory domain-containing protein [Williamsia sp.]
MTKRRIYESICTLLLFALSSFIPAQAQTVEISGTVKDSATSAPLQNVSVYIKGSRGTRTDSAGNYTLTLRKAASYVEFSNVGYKTLRRSLNGNGSQTINVSLQASFNELSTVTVTNKKIKYSNKNNPAVELIRHVIENKPNNRIESYSTASFERYEKIMLSLDKISPKITNNKILKKYDFIFDNNDTTKFAGKSLTPVYLEEKLSQNYIRKDPDKSKTVILGEKRVDYGEFIDVQGVSNYLNRLYEDVEIYDNNISLLTNQFLSPIADMGPTFYMYFLGDTVEMGTDKLVKLYFSPRNANDLLFRGTMFITLDGRYAVQKINMIVSSRINLNFVRQLHVIQDYEKDPEGRYRISKSDVMADFGITKKGGGIYGERNVFYKKFVTNAPIPDSVFGGKAVVTVENAANQPDSFWISHYWPDTLTAAEAKVYANIDSLKNMRSFRRLLDWGTLLLAGYKSLGPVEIGPANTFYSFNPIEGLRLRFGGRSTTKLSKRYYFEAYGAYGFKDERWKYFLSSTYSINNKSIYAFPANYVRASFQRDTKIPGQELQFVQEDNFLLSFKRGNNDKWLYNDIFRLNYLHEFNSHISYNVGFKYWKQEPAGTISYVKMQNNTPKLLQDLTTSELSLELRWAPNERFYQTKLYRVPIVNKYPIFLLRYIAGVKGLFNGEYNYQNLFMHAEKRFYLSQLGYTDVTVEGAYIFGKLPFPLMTIHRANQTYAYQLISYNLMNFLEFVSDHHVTVYADHYFNGFIFNKIPLLKKLKLREVIAGKILYGGTRDENNPYKDPSLIKFPTTNGAIATYNLTNTPYLEGSVGITNIFKLIRLDVVKRFTYLDHPEIAKWGIRGRVKFDF